VHNDLKVILQNWLGWQDSASLALCARRFFVRIAHFAEPLLLRKRTVIIPLTQSHKKKPTKCGHFLWLGWRDSNPRMLVPETSALPLGDIPLAELNYKRTWGSIRVTFRDPAISS
jgi:hypothetical protein